MKNLHFCSDQIDIQAILPTHELQIGAKQTARKALYEVK